LSSPQPAHAAESLQFRNISNLKLEEILLGLKILQPTENPLSSFPILSAFQLPSRKSRPPAPTNKTENWMRTEHSAWIPFCKRKSQHQHRTMGPPSEIILGELSPKSYLILELATNTLGIFKEN
jgi:hypothetical protein